MQNFTFIYIYLILLYFILLYIIREQFFTNVSLTRNQQMSHFDWLNVKYNQFFLEIISYTNIFLVSKCT